MSAHLFDKLKRVELRTNIFVNMPNGIDGDIVQTPQSEPAWVYRKPHTKWKDLHCIKEERVGPFNVKTTCNDMQVGNPRRYNIFVRLRKKRRLTNLYDYARLIQTDVISRTDHEDLMKYISERHDELVKHTRRDKKVITINHNLDVGILHFKFRFV